MSDWISENKGLSPWKVKHVDRTSYNEGDHIATYASPVWSMEKGSDVPITPTHKPCGYWTKDYVPPPTNLPPAGLIAWYPVDEGSGTVITNIVSPNVNRLPNLALVAGSTFWSQVSGFGYWSISPTVTQVYATWAGFDPFPTKAGTIIIFGREARGIQDGNVWATVCQCMSNQGLLTHRYYGGVQHGGYTGDVPFFHTYTFSPAADYYDKPFVMVFTHNGVSTEIMKSKYVGGSWVSDTKTDSGGFDGNVTGAYIGSHSGYLGTANRTWKGIIGDYMILNVLLTDAEINELMVNGFVLNGKTFSASRWGL